MFPQFSRRAVTRTLLAACAFPAITGHAATLARPSDLPILVIRGKITNTNEERQSSLDRKMLEALGMETIVTKTPWYRDPVRFEGVPLSRLMEYVGAVGDRVIVLALNDYSADIPISDFRKYGPLLALKRDGQYMPVSDKGPLFVVYPYDSSPELQQDRFYMRSVWQVCELDVR